MTHGRGWRGHWSPVRRRFGAAPFPGARPDKLLVADLTYAVIWADFVYAALVIDVLGRRIAGWCVRRR